MKEEKELLFSVTTSDLVVRTFRASKKGGQKVNKTESGVEILHPPSGAVGRSIDERSQYQNKKTALRRMADSASFRAWATAVSRGLKTPKEIEKEVSESLADGKNIKTEVRTSKKNNEWTEVDEKELT